MSLKGLTQNELYKLKRSVGVSNNNKSAEISPHEANKIILKAIEKGNSRKDISNYLNLTTTTMIGRTLALFENLHPSLHKNVIYGNRRKRIIKGNFIGFQQAVELSKLDHEMQIKLYQMVLKERYSWGEILSIKQLLLRSGKTFEEIIKEMNERKGRTETLHLVERISLSEISPKIFSQKQAKRDEIFLNLMSQNLNEEIQEVFLGSSTYKIVFSRKEYKPKSSDLRKLKQKILEILKSHG